MNKTLIGTSLCLIMMSLNPFALSKPLLPEHAFYSLGGSDLKIASWNIYWLGKNKNNSRNADDYLKLNRIARELDADVIGLQEVESAEYASKVFGDAYSYYFSSRPNSDQRVGLAVKKSSGLRVKASEYKELDVGNVRYGMDLTLSRNNQSLRLMVVHLKSGCFIKPLNDSNPACVKLNKQLEPLEAWIDQRASENLPFMLLGDFNRRLGVEEDERPHNFNGIWNQIDDGEPTKYANLWRANGRAKASCWNAKYPDFIDHFILDPRARNMYVENSFSEYVYPSWAGSSPYKISDHCPLSIKMRF